mgnify:CR=1 FL=1
MNWNINFSSFILLFSSNSLPILIAIPTHTRSHTIEFLHRITWHFQCRNHVSYSLSFFLYRNKTKKNNNNHRHLEGSLDKLLTNKWHLKNYSIRIFSFFFWSRRLCSFFFHLLPLVQLEEKKKHFFFLKTKHERKSKTNETKKINTKKFVILNNQVFDDNIKFTRFFRFWLNSLSLYAGLFLYRHYYYHFNKENIIIMNHHMASCGHTHSIGF